MPCFAQDNDFDVASVIVFIFAYGVHYFFHIKVAIHYDNIYDNICKFENIRGEASILGSKYILLHFIL